MLVGNTEKFTKATGKHETYQTLSKIMAHFGTTVTDLSHSDKKYIIVPDESSKRFGRKNSLENMQLIKITGTTNQLSFVKFFL